MTELKVLELEREWGTVDMVTDKTEEAKEIETQDHIVWEPNPPPLTISDGSKYNKSRSCRKK